MTTPRLSRIFTVSGSSTTTERRLIAWGFDTFTTGFVDDQAGEWQAFAGFQSLLADAAMASVYASTANSLQFNPQSVNADGTDQADLPRLGDLLDVDNRADDGGWVRLSLADNPGAYIQWTVTQAYLRNSGEILIDFANDGGQLVGDDFVIGCDSYIELRLERRLADQSQTTTTNRPAWGELTERGSALGVIDITAVEGGQAVTGSQEEAGAVVRYDPDLAIGTSLTDDLDREWLIRGSRTLQDRRYLEFDLVRNVQGVS